MNKKKVLIFIDWYLPGFRAGGPIRSCANLVSHLSGDFDFYVVTSDRDYMTDLPYPDVKTDVWNTLPDGSKVWYISKPNLRKSCIRRLIGEICPDIIYLNGVYSKFFTRVPSECIDKKKTKVIVACRGMLAPSALAIKPIKKKIYLFFIRLTSLFKNVTFQASTPEEKDHIEAVFPNSVISIAPNLSRKIIPLPGKRTAKQPGELLLLHVARIAPEKNLLFALETLRKAEGKIMLDIFGAAYDVAYWKECTGIIRSLPRNILVNYKGVTDADSLMGLMEQYHFLFHPTRGENFGHVILEAMSTGLPVIISDKTPWKDLPSKNAGWDIALDKPSRFESVIGQCVKMNEEDYDRYSKGAFSFASSFINDAEKVEANKRLFS